jgi:hypothetical protein
MDEVANFMRKGDFNSAILLATDRNFAVASLLHTSLRGEKGVYVIFSTFPLRCVFLHTWK